MTGFTLPGLVIVALPLAVLLLGRRLIGWDGV
jgi:hypothetical protein